MKKYGFALFLIIILFLSACGQKEGTPSETPSRPIEYPGKSLEALPADELALRMEIIQQASSVSLLIFNEGDKSYYLVPEEVVVQRQENGVWLTVERAWRHPHHDLLIPGVSDVKNRLLQPGNMEKIGLRMEEYNWLAFRPTKELFRAAVPIYDEGMTLLGYFMGEFQY